MLYDRHSNRGNGNGQAFLDIFGYARASSDRQVESVPKQLEWIGDHAVAYKPELKAGLPQWLREYVYIDDGVSAESTPYYERPAFVALSKAITEGCLVIAWRWDRFDRDMCRCVGAVGLFAEKNATLYMIHDRREYFLENIADRLFSVICAGFAGYETHQKNEQLLSARRRKRAQGILSHHRPQPGYRRFFRTEPNSGSPRLVYTIDEEERALIRELEARVMAGESVRSVWLDFRSRKETTSDGKPWFYRRCLRIEKWMRRCRDFGLIPWQDVLPYRYETGLTLQ